MCGRTIGNQQTSPLLQLHGEIKNATYAYVLGGYNIHVECVYSGQWPHEAVTLEIEMSDPQHGLVKKSTALALSKVCHQTRFETALMLFEINELGFEVRYHPPTVLSSFFDLLSCEQRKSIRN